MDIDIFIITETNITPQIGKHIDTLSYGYKSFWTGSLDKIKGIGVGILVAEHLAFHIGHVNLTAVEDYLIHMQLLFKGCTMHILGLYAPPAATDAHIQVQLTQYISQLMHDHRNTPLHRFICAGDFNSIVHPLLDKRGNTRFNRNPSKLVRMLQQQLCIDTFRFMQPNAKTFTWSSQRQAAGFSISTRIDHIWASGNWAHDIAYCEIEQSALITGSDHDIVLCQFHTGELIRNWKLSARKRRDNPRTVYDYENISDEQWDDYQTKATAIFDSKEQLTNLIQLQTPHLQQDIDIIWTMISDSITEAAITTLPHKKIPFRNPRKPKKLLDLRPAGLTATAARLRKIIKAVTNHGHLPLIQSELTFYNSEIAELNEEVSLTIAPLQFPISNTWIEHSKRCLYTIKHKLRLDIQTAKRTAVQLSLDRRAEDTCTNQRRMLNNTLNREHRRIVVDRILTVEEGVPTLHTSPDDILRVAPTQYKALLKPRKHGFDEINKEWLQIYTPLERIDENIYSHLMDVPTVDEWSRALEKCSLQSAPGISGIGYRLIKKLPPIAQDILRLFAGIIFGCSMIPRQWKTSMIYPIPKPDEWNFSLEKTRPILLLECLRKLYFRIINTRLSILCVSHDILQGPNFAGLPGGNTRTPIHILNNVMEDARTQRKQCWIAFQDMSKAFDSVGMVPLQYALRRLKIPESVIQLLINTFDGRSMRIITEYGLSDPFTAADGIDQGEVISPLLWRIFYDPLLCRIAQDNSLGYTMEVAWPQRTSFSQRVAALAYADDTAWIADSKDKLQHTIDISNQFFRLNDIDINGKKSELLVIHPHRQSLPASYFQVTMGSIPHQVHAALPRETIRYLGVWFASCRTIKQQEVLIKHEIQQITDAINTKRLTIDQVVYINNRVLIPRLEYRLSATLLDVMKCIHLYSPMTKAAKQAMKLPATSHTNIISHPGTTGLITLGQAQRQHHFTEFVIRLNEDTLATSTTRLRLRHFQMINKLGSSIWDAPCETILKLDVKDNLAVQTLLQMKIWDFNLQPAADPEPWTLNFSGSALFDLLVSLLTFSGPKLHSNKIMKSFLDCSIPVFSINQCITADSSAYLPWSTIKGNMGFSKQGKTPLWYTFLSTQHSLGNTPTQNPETPYYPPCLPSKDKRKLEWIYVSTNSGIMLYGRISSKTAATISFTHWIATPSESHTDFMYTRCSGCPNSTNTRQGCCTITTRRVNSSTIHPSLVRHVSQEHVQILPQIMTQSHTHLPQPQQESPLLPIMVCLTRDIALIHDDITKDGRLRQQLIHHHNELIRLDLPIIDIYTDGSLDHHVHTNGASLMGSSWYIPDVDMDFACASTLWPSSTKAELIAIWMALLTIPSQSSVNILTDSQAAMDGILTHHTKNIRQRLATPNSPILDRIIFLVDSKGINVVYVKVKGHAGIIGNEIADKLAKEVTRMARDSDDLILPMPTGTASSLTTSLNWNNATWTGALRKNITVLMGLQQSADWINNNAIKEFFDEDRNNRVPPNIRDNILRIDNNVDRIDSLDRLISWTNCIWARWDYTWIYYKTLRHANRTGPHASDFMTFVLKCMHNILPTGDNLHKRIETIYDDWKCTFCNRENETLQHLFECHTLATTWNTIRNSVIDNINATLRKNNIIPEQPLTRDNFLRPVAHIDPVRTLAKGIVPAHLIADLDTLRIKGHRTVIISAALHHSINEFRERIWIPRCSNNADKEKHLGITKLDKRTWRKTSYPAADNIDADTNPQSHYHELIDRWKRNTEAAIIRMKDYVKKGLLGMDKGWSCNKYTVKRVSVLM
jgi:exonuclease III/ribonuclease HI